MGDEFGHEDQGIGDDDQQVDDACRGDSQGAPRGCADGFGNDFRNDEDEQCEQGRGDGKGFVAEDLVTLGTHACGAHRVRNRVEREDGRDRLVDVLFVFFQKSGSRFAFLFEHRDERHGSGQHDGFKNRAKERDSQSREEIEEK